MSKKKPTPAPETVLCWHFVSEDRLLRFGDDRLVEAGRTYSTDAPLVLCESGMHASERALDAVGYAPGPVVCRVRLSGEIVRGGDKLCGRSREVLWLADASDTLHRFAMWCAEQALLAERAAGREPHPASFAALTTKLLWLDGKATDEELHASASAAYASASAAYAYASASAASAAYAYASAAYARSAYAYAASAAYASAAYARSAYAYASSARSVAVGAQNDRLTAMLLALAPAGYSEVAS